MQTGDNRRLRRRRPGARRRRAARRPRCCARPTSACWRRSARPRCRCCAACASRSSRPATNCVRSASRSIAGCVYDSNRYTLWAHAAAPGRRAARPRRRARRSGCARSGIRRAAGSADAVITSGGVSVGEADHTKQVMAELGDVLFWRIAMRPGRPMAIGRIGESGPVRRSAILFGLPGNPVAVMVTFYAFVRDALLRDERRALGARCRCCAPRAPRRSARSPAAPSTSAASSAARADGALAGRDHRLRRARASCAA